MGKVVPFHRILLTKKEHETFKYLKKKLANSTSLEEAKYYKNILDNMLEISDLRNKQRRKR